MLMLVSAIRELAWTMTLVEVLLNMGMHIVIGLLSCQSFDAFESFRVKCWISISSFSIIVVRIGRSNLGYGGSRSSISSQDSHGLYSSRQGMGYGGGMFFLLLAMMWHTYWH